MRTPLLIASFQALNRNESPWTTPEFQARPISRHSPYTTLEAPQINNEQPKTYTNNIVLKKVPGEIVGSHMRGVGLEIDFSSIVHKY